MKQVISSRFTFIYKLVLPILLVVYGGFGIIILLIKRQSQDFLSLLTIFILMIIGGVVLYQTKKKLKKVWVENNARNVQRFCQSAPQTTRTACDDCNLIGKVECQRIVQRPVSPRGKTQNHALARFKILTIVSETAFQLTICVLYGTKFYECAGSEF